MNTGTTSVLVAYDGSPDSELALIWGSETAALTGAPLKVMVVNEVSEQARPDVRRQAERWADTICARARAATHEVSVPVEIVIEHGESLPALLEAASKAAILVAGSRGHNRWDSFWLGSTTQHLAGHAACTVAVVRRRHDPRSHQIIVGIDGSGASRRALEFAVDRALLTGEQVLAVHAYEYPSFADDGRIGVRAADIDTSAIDEAERLAEELVAEVCAERPDVVVRSSAVVGRPGRALARLSDEASLVVVGSRGRTGVAELILGSVSQEVLHRAECPVVVVR